MRVTRRQATAILFVGGGVFLAPGAASFGAAEHAAIDELKLPSEVLAQLEQRAPGVIEEARWLEELPLEGLAPGFVFLPHS